MAETEKPVSSEESDKKAEVFESSADEKMIGLEERQEEHDDKECDDCEDGGNEDDGYDEEEYYEDDYDEYDEEEYDEEEYEQYDAEVDEPVRKGFRITWVDVAFVVLGLWLGSKFGCTK